jgi:hypothetical protein
LRALPIFDLYKPGFNAGDTLRFEGYQRIPLVWGYSWRNYIAPAFTYQGCETAKAYGLRKPKKNPNVELRAPGFEPTTSLVASRLSTWMQISLKISEFEKIMITLQIKPKSGLKLNLIVKCRVFI